MPCKWLIHWLFWIIHTMGSLTLRNWKPLVPSWQVTLGPHPVHVPDTKEYKQLSGTVLTLLYHWQVWQETAPGNHYAQILPVNHFCLSSEWHQQWQWASTVPGTRKLIPTIKMTHLEKQTSADMLSADDFVYGGKNPTLWIPYFN